VERSSCQHSILAAFADSMGNVRRDSLLEQDKPVNGFFHRHPFFGFDQLTPSPNDSVALGSRDVHVRQRHLGAWLFPERLNGEQHLLVGQGVGSVGLGKRGPPRIDEGNPIDVVEAVHKLTIVRRFRPVHSLTPS
jgi:hypothetical protein